MALLWLWSLLNSISSFSSSLKGKGETRRASMNLWWPKVRLDDIKVSVWLKEAVPNYPTYSTCHHWGVGRNPTALRHDRSTDPCCNVRTQKNSILVWRVLKDKLRFLLKHADTLTAAGSRFGLLKPCRCVCYEVKKDEASLDFFTLLIIVWALNCRLLWNTNAVIYLKCWALSYFQERLRPVSWLNVILGSRCSSEESVIVPGYCSCVSTNTVVYRLPFNFWRCAIVRLFFL